MSTLPRHVIAVKKGTLLCGFRCWVLNPLRAGLIGVKCHHHYRGEGEEYGLDVQPQQTSQVRTLVVERLWLPCIGRVGKPQASHTGGDFTAELPSTWPKAKQHVLPTWRQIPRKKSQSEFQRLPAISFQLSPWGYTRGQGVTLMGTLPHGRKWDWKGINALPHAVEW